MDGCERERLGYRSKPPNSGLQGEIQLDRAFLQMEYLQVALLSLLPKSGVDISILARICKIYLWKLGSTP